MTRKFHIPFLIILFASLAIVFAGKPAERKALAKPAASHELLRALPASDFILYADAQRAMTEILPSLVFTTPEARARFEAELNEFQAGTGLDPRLLDAVAVGVNLKSSMRLRDHDFVLIFRGRFDAQSTLDTGIQAAISKSNGLMEKQSLQYEGRTIYLIGRVTKRAVVAITGAEPSSTDSGATPVSPADNNTRAGLASDTMAFVVLDTNTIAFGNLKSVRATIDASLGRGVVSDELVQLASRTPGAAASFSGNLTPETVQTVRLGSNKIGESIGSIRQVYGSFNLNGTDAEAFINLRTAEAEDARKLGSTLNAFKFMARLARGGGLKTGPSMEAIINGVNVDTVGNEVQISLRVAQADLAPLIKKF